MTILHAADSFATYPSLQNKIVVVTGGGSGIGAEIVTQFARQGARVALFDIAIDAARELLHTLEGSVPNLPFFVPCNVADIAALQTALSRTAQELGPIDVLVNNAGNDDRHSIEAITAEYWDDRMAVNLRHQFFAIQAVMAGMTATGGGSIVNIGSIAWLIPSTQQAAYVTAKAALVGLTRTMARELGPANIRVNCVLPGAIITERQKRLWLTPQYIATVRNAQSLKRDLLPADVARLVLFLAADDSSAMTGQNYIIDGGWV